MEFDNSWTAFLDPGKATSYFDLERPPPFAADAVGFRPGNAWWLAELSRLIYRQEEGETGRVATGFGRNHFLGAHGLRETCFVNRQGTQYALIESLVADKPFAVLVFRGSSQPLNWLTDINLMPSRWPPDGLVHQGFKAAFDRIWPELEARLKSVDGVIAGRTFLYYTGHSLGAALATMAAVRRKPHGLYTFGSPRIGNAAFAATLNCPAFRLVNNRDCVSGLPPALGPLPFRHTGTLYYITHDSCLLAEPSRERVAADRRQPDFWRRRPAEPRFFGPPQCMADHAPVNYVAHLERVLAAARDTL